MAKTREDVAQNLKSHFIGTIGTMEKEYAWQIAKWKPYFALVASARSKAEANVNKVLEQVKSDARAADQLLLMAVSFAGGAAIGWFASKVKADIYPKYAAKVQWEDSFSHLGYSTKLTHDTARAAFFGDTIKGALGLGLDAVVKKITPEDPKDRDKSQDVQLSRLLRGSDYATFENAINGQIDEEIKSMLALFGKMHTNANNNLALGHELLNALEESKNPRTSPDQLEIIGTARIQKHVDGMRANFAKEWWYFGNNPDLSTLRSLDDKIELELWALWVLDQDFKIVQVLNTKVVMGKDRIPVTHRITSRLVNGLFQTALIDLEYHTQRTVGFALGMLHKETIPAGDLPKLIAWAKKHPGKFAQGNVGFKPRNIGTVADANSIFKG